MQYAIIDKDWLWTVIETWDKYLPSPIRLIACGGTALTLQNFKASTKDIDFLVPKDDEYRKLIKTLKKLDYRKISGFKWTGPGGFEIDLFTGRQIFTTELLESPLDPDNHIKIRQLKKIYVGVLNDEDFIISKMFRGTLVDEEDCLRLIRARGESFDRKKLEERYREAAQYQLNPDAAIGSLTQLMRRSEE
ncbi:MAG: hypothetical protein CO113_09295 [Elusimicrobia bacterium CG_4_9_14_3_um_filter_62_55]|nr:MAG: hypothetical protein COR54_16890 [Elusimicrobia bacterium CG22_combo_CG10-13_8_21_14_all_63_91]PJA16700.1 MAG: hypothetical protein COX66_06950 [Elusimicrobia bacterium CG_4_10_14_0_2_um_filter_63_34]PJB25332.1 MAG: hypothetical protein CO113_09295 [Elusimicrobia bacterium CG_4_9_14_3_um_filter_62_55]